MSGLLTVFGKELADDFTSKRFIVLFALILMAGVFAIYVAAESIKEVAPEAQFVFLKLFTTPGEGLLSFLTFVVFFVPIVGIALGFDAINSERNNGTLSRLLSQPIFRDAVINGKFLAGVVTIAIMLLSIILLVAGIGLRMIGVPPSSEEVIRLMAFFTLGIVYGAFWLGLAILFSIFFRRVATSALASIAVWIFFTFFIFMVAGLVADMLVPVDEASMPAELLRNAEVNRMVMRISPIILFQEAVTTLLDPLIRTLGFITLDEIGWMIPSPLPLGQSLLLVWPHITYLIALTAICFAISYAKFMCEEIRST
jgi:ABC-2 type transport system permease protein